MRYLFAAAACLVIAAACGGAASDRQQEPGFRPSEAGVIDLDAGTPRTVPEGPSGLPCNVETILANNCRKCHSDPPQAGAPMPLLTWDHLHAATRKDPSKKVYEMVASRIDNDADPMPPSPNPRLSVSDRNVIKDWVAAGAPKDPNSCTVDVPDAGTGLSCAVTKTLRMGNAYAMPADADDQYVCWGVDVTADTPTHIIGFGPRIDNKAIVHHVVMYETNSSYPSTPTPCSSGSALAWRMVLGWAPGVRGIELPPKAGFPIKDTGTHYVVQMHYSNINRLTNQTDDTKIDVCTSPPREFEADVAAFGTQDIRIPPKPPAGGVFRRNCTIKVPSLLAGKHLFTAMPHMHKIGVAMSTTLERSGTTLDLGTMADYDFNSQAWLPIDDVVTQEGDVIRTKCGYTNTTDREVGFGEKTADEMCYSFTMYYPRITTPGWTWALPSLTSECVSEP